MARPTLASMLPGIIAGFAFVTSMFAGLYCRFISFTSTDGSDITLYFGIWYYQGWKVVENQLQGTVILETCYNYPDGTYHDAKWKSAMAFSTMTLIISGIVTFWALLAFALYPTKKMYEAGGMIYMVCCLFQGLSLLFLDSNACHNNTLLTMMQKQVQQLVPSTDLAFPSSCSMSTGANCAIAATVLWFVAAIAALKVDPPRRGPITTQTQDVTYTRTTEPGGEPLLREHVVQGYPAVREP